MVKRVGISAKENFITLQLKLQVGSDSYILKPFKQIHTHTHTHIEGSKDTKIKITRIFFSKSSNGILDENQVVQILGQIKGLCII